MKNRNNLLIAGAVVLIIGAIGYYYFQNTSTNSTQELASNEEVMEESDNPNRAVLIKSATITVPDTEETVQITFTGAELVEYGDFENNPENYYGTISLGEEVTEMEDGALVTTVLVNSGGSGGFVYLAVFEEVDGSWQMTSSEFLGDRVEIESIEVDENTITVSYLEHGEDQAMAEDPTTEVVAVYTYEEGNLVNTSE